MSWRCSALPLKLVKSSLRLIPALASKSTSSFFVKQDKPLLKRRRTHLRRRSSVVLQMGCSILMVIDCCMASPVPDWAVPDERCCSLSIYNEREFDLRHCESANAPARTDPPHDLFPSNPEDNSRGRLPAGAPHVSDVRLVRGDLVQDLTRSRMRPVGEILHAQEPYHLFFAVHHR